MKTVKRILTLVLSVSLIASFCLTALPAMAEDVATPCVKTTVNADGSVELSRDAKAHNSWPSVRTLSGVESAPAIDLSVTNTLYFDFEVTGCSWMLQMDFTGVYMKFAKSITAATGGTALANSDADGAAGTYKGSINLVEAIKAVAADSADPNATNANTIAGMTKTIIPGMKLYVVDTGTTGKIKINKLYLSTADDQSGANCQQMSIGLLYPEEESEEPIKGVKYFPLDMNNGNGGYDDAWEVEAGENFYQRWNEAESVATATKEESSESVTTKKDTAVSTATKATTAAKGSASEGMNPVLWVVIAVAAVAVIAVVVVLVLKKKNGGNGAPPADTTVDGVNGVVDQIKGQYEGDKETPEEKKDDKTE